MNRSRDRHVHKGVTGRARSAGKGHVADDEVVRALHAEHAGPLLRYAMYLTSGDRQRAEDVVVRVLREGFGDAAAIFPELGFEGLEQL